MIGMIQTRIPSVLVRVRIEIAIEIIEIIYTIDLEEILKLQDLR